MFSRKTLKSFTANVFALSFLAATVLACGAKKEEEVEIEETPVEEVAPMEDEPPMVEDTTAVLEIDTTESE